MLRYFFYFVVAAVGLGAQTVPVVGNWLGTLDAGAAKLRLVFHVTAAEGSGIAATLDSLDQNVKGIPVKDAVFAGGKLTLTIAAIGGSFEGAMNAAGSQLTGTFTQAGMSFPLVLERQTGEVAARKRPQSPVGPFPYESQEVTFESGGSTLAGTLTLPKGAGPFAAALLISGSGPQDRDETLFEHKPFAVIADALTRRGIAVLRVDDRGMGGSAGKSDGQTLEDMATDVLAGVGFLKSQAKIDGSRIGLIGHSEGGIVGPMAAVRSKDVAFVVMLAGPGVGGGELLRAQGALIRQGARPVEGQIQDVILKAIEQTPGAATMDAKELVGKIRESWIAFRDGQPEPMRTNLSSPAVQARMEAEFARASSREMRTIILSKPAETLRKLTVPVLAMNGGRDIQVPVAQNLPAIAAALAAGGNTDYTVMALPGLNHLFQRCKACTVAEYGELEETFAPVALEVMGDWVARVTRR